MKPTANWPPKIESGVPVPEKRPVVGYMRAAFQLLAQAKIGDSMFFPGRTQKSISIPALRVGQKGWYTSSTTTCNGVSGVRVWKMTEPGKPARESKRKLIKKRVDTDKADLSRYE